MIPNSQPYNEGFVSDGCTGIPDLWFGICCKMHDFYHWVTKAETGDLEFLFCLIGVSVVCALGLSLTVWLGMLVLRPIYRKYQALIKK